MIANMPRPRLLYIHREITRHGKAVWYFRREAGGKRIRLPNDYGSAEFNAAYAAALTGMAVTTTPGQPSQGSLAWLIERFRHSSAWASASSATRKQRDRFFRQIIQTSGHIAAAKITAKAIREGRERRKDTPDQANNFLKAMRALFKWAVEDGKLKFNPAKDVAFIDRETDGHPPWSAADIAAFEDRWPLGTKECLAMHLFLYTGLRLGDAACAGRQHVRNGVIELPTEKTGEMLYIPIAPELAVTIAASPLGDMAFLSNEWKRPFVKESLGNWFRRACRAAGVEKSAHGLRKTLATMTAEAGASEMELQAFFGWRSSRMSAIYTRKAERKKLAEQAQSKRMAAVAIPAPPSPGKGVARKTPMKSKRGEGNGGRYN